MKNKYVKIDRADLKVGHVITAISLRDGSVLKDVSVTKVWKYPDDHGFDYKTAGTGTRYGTTVGHGQAKEMIFLRNTEVQPDDWPPEKDDVWKIDGIIWHSMAGGMWKYGGGTMGNSAEELLTAANGDAELLFRVKK
jgi:hypothetical protein